METNIPARTAGFLTLPSGDIVWIQTLNTLLKQDADKCARRFAQKDCRSLLKGGEDHESVLIEVRGMNQEEQATFIAGDDYWTIHQTALDLHPDPMEPEQGELTPQQFTEACSAWDVACGQALIERTKYEAEQFEAAKRAAMRLSVRDRRERTISVYFTQQFVQAYNRRMRFETLWRAVRDEEDHLKRFYASVEALEDADDATQIALSEFYEGLDVPQPMVPTSPAQS